MTPAAFTLARPAPAATSSTEAAAARAMSATSSSSAARPALIAGRPRWSPSSRREAYGLRPTAGGSCARRPGRSRGRSSRRGRAEGPAQHELGVEQEAAWLEWSGRLHPLDDEPRGGARHLVHGLAHGGELADLP